MSQILIQEATQSAIRTRRLRRPLQYLLLALLALVFLRPLSAQVEISVGFGPPALPVYEQPLCPEEGYIWTPGYWAYDDDDGYYWVPGTWIPAPQPGYLWTPPWWGWGGSAFIFHAGYWGPHIGFYGGINYGFGYFGNGFEGGRWQGDHFFYNRSVTNVNVTNIHNTYNTTVINNTNVNRVSYNGGNGGITARPTPEQEAYGHEQHTPPVAAQMQHVQTARSNPQLRASTNQGKPPIAATDRAASFSGRNVVAAREAGAPYHPPANAAANRPGNQPNPAANRPGEPSPAANNEHPNPTHASQLQPHTAPTPGPNTGNPQMDQKYQQQQQKLIDKQNQQHQQLMQRQQAQDQKAQQNNYNQQRTQQMEQQHAQQTQHMEQQHAQQMQHMQSRQAGPQGGGHPR